MAEELDIDYPVLYLLARTDLDSMNPGKLAAQCGHAVSLFMRHMEVNALRESTEYVTYKEWLGDRGFGTKITLDAGSVANLKYIIDCFQEAGFISGLVVDPGYPLMDGEVVHKIKLITCAYVFGTKSELAPYLEGSGLYR